MHQFRVYRRLGDRSELIGSAENFGGIMLLIENGVHLNVDFIQSGGYYSVCQLFPGQSKEIPRAEISRGEDGEFTVRPIRARNDWKELFGQTEF